MKRKKQQGCSRRVRRAFEIKASVKLTHTHTKNTYVQPEYRGRADVRLDGVPDRGGHTSKAGRITRLIFSCSFVIVVFVSVRIT